MPRKATKRRRVVGLLTDSDYVQLKSVADRSDVSICRIVRTAVNSFVRQWKRDARKPIKDRVHRDL